MILVLLQSDLVRELFETMQELSAVLVVRPENIKSICEEGRLVCDMVLILGAAEALAGIDGPTIAPFILATARRLQDQSYTLLL